MSFRYDFFTLFLFFKTVGKVFYVIDQCPGVFRSQRIFPSRHGSSRYTFYNGSIQIFITRQGSGGCGSKLENSFSEIPWPRVEIFGGSAASIAIFTMAEYAHMHENVTPTRQQRLVAHVSGFRHPHIIMSTFGSENTTITFAMIHVPMIHGIRLLCSIFFA